MPDVRMPDGTIIRNVPNGVTKAQLLEKLGRNGYNTAELLTPQQEESALEKIPVVGDAAAWLADIPLNVASGLASVGKAGAEAFGASSGVADTLGDIAKGAESWRSSEARRDALINQLEQQQAEGKGTWEEIKAAGRSFARSPLDITSQVAGSAIPFIAAGALTGGAAVPVGLGALVGAGTIKGAIYEATYNEFKKAGASEEKAAAAAEQAQEYGGENIDQIALGTALGGLASGVGFEPAIARTIGKRAAERVAANVAAREAAEAAGAEIARKGLIRGGFAGAAKEAVPEAFQGGQERYAANLALQRQGFDVDPWQGVAGQAAVEGISSLLLGGYGGVRETQQENAAATAKQYADQVEALPDSPTEEDVAPIAQWAVRRGFSEEEAGTIARNAAEQKARVAQAKAELEAEQARAREERTAGIEPSPEPDITAPGMPGVEEQLTAPPVDIEEQAAMQRAYEQEAGAQIVPPAEAVTPATQLREQLEGAPTQKPGGFASNLAAYGSMVESGQLPPVGMVNSLASRMLDLSATGELTALAEDPQLGPVVQQFFSNEAATLNRIATKKAPEVRQPQQPSEVTPFRATQILTDPVVFSDFMARTGMDEQEARAELTAIEEGESTGLKYSRGRRAKDTQTASLGFDMPVQAAPGEAMKRAEYSEFRFAPEEEKAALQAQAAKEAEANLEQATALQQREAERRDERLVGIQTILREQAPENAVYKVEYNPDDANPYRLVAETQLGKKPEEIIKAKSLDEFEAAVSDSMEELTPYIPYAPAGLEAVEQIKPTEQEAPTVATRMVQDFVAEVDAAHEAGQIDNNQRAQLLQRMYRPNAYRMVDGRQVPNDAIAKFEAEALEAASVARNAAAADKEAAETAAKEANTKLRTAVKNALLNPARAALKTMVETRQDEQLGARIRKAEAEGVLREEAKKRKALEAATEGKPDMVKEGRRLVPAATPETVAAKAELRETKIDLKEAKVQKYRKAPGKLAKGVTTDAVQRVVDAVTKGWKSTNPVTVVQSIADIKDAKLQRAIARDNAQDAEGFVAPDGTIYLVADNLTDEARVKAVLFHEALGHLGLEKLFRNNLDQALTTLYRGNAQLKADVDKWRQDNPGAYERDSNPLARAVEEVLAERSEKGQLQPTLMQRIATMVRNFARRMGLNLKINNNDVAAILSMAHAQIVNGPSKSTTVKGLRYIREDRIRASAQAAKTFLKELGVYTNRELMEIPGEDAIRAASRVGIDQEWLDYFNSRQLAARAPEGAEPIKLPQPDMAKYMPKYSRNTSKADAKKMAQADASLSEGERKVNKSFSTSGLTEGVEDLSAGHVSKDYLGALKGNWGLFSPAKQAAILKALPTSGILGWIKPDHKALHAAMVEIDDRVHKMNALKQRILHASDELARDIEDFSLEYGTEQLAHVQALSRINEVSPDEFDSVEEALEKNKVIVEIEKQLLGNTNDKAQTRKLIDEVKDIVMQRKDSVNVKGDKITMAAPLIVKLRALEKLAVDSDAVKLQVEQLAEMSRRVRAAKEAWTKLGEQKGGHRLYKEMRSYYKDMFEAELALLDERITTLTDKDEAIRIKDMRAKLMREISSPEERKKSGDLFWNLDADLFQKDYFPFMREGQFWMRVEADKTGTREREFYTFETERELVEAQRKVATRLGIDPERNDGIIKTGNDIGELQEYLKTEDALMQKVFDIVGKARDRYDRTQQIDLKELTDSIYQTWLMTTPERSVRRRLMHAEEVVGFSPDVFRHYKQQATAYANQLSKLAYAGQIKMAVDTAREIVDDPERSVTEKRRLNAFVSELETRVDQELRPDPHSTLVNVMNRASYYYYLTAARTALIQLTSIPIRVVPRLWRDYGVREGTAAWLKYMRVWDSLGRVQLKKEKSRFGDRLDAVMPSVNGSNFVQNDADLKWAMKRGMEAGILETVHDTLVQNERATPGKTRTGIGRTAEDMLANTGKIMSFLFNGTENISRQASYYMTFELALKKFRKENPGKPAQDAREYAYKQAAEVLRSALGDYSSWERPSLAKKDWTRALFLFKMHPIIQTKFLVGAMRDIVTNAGGERAGAMKELTGVLMMAGMFGGLMGMPLYNAMTYALMAAFGPDKDDDEDVRALMGGDPRVAYDPDISFRSWMNDKFGATEIAGMPLSDILMYGPIGTATNTELSSSTSLDLKNMWFRDAVVGDSMEDTILSTLIANVPGLSMAGQMLRGYESFQDGNIEDGLKKMFPAFFRSWAAAAFNEEQGIKNRRGDVLIPKEDIGAADNFRDVLGFRAPKLSRIQQYYITRAKNEDAIKKERGDILDRFEKAWNAGEITSRDKLDEFIKDEVVPFNRTYPDPEFLVTEDTLYESLKRRAGIRARTIEGVQYDKKTAMKDIAQQERFVR